MLLAYRLVKLIETHSDGLARSLHNRYRTDATSVRHMLTCPTLN